MRLHLLLLLLDAKSCAACAKVAAIARACVQAPSGTLSERLLL
jgi:hypothetical protein